MAVVLIAWAPSREAYRAVDDEVGRTAPPFLDRESRAARCDRRLRSLKERVI
jgi:hypothetical protein